MWEVGGEGDKEKYQSAKMTWSVTSPEAYMVCVLPGSGKELAPGQQWLLLASVQPLAQPLAILFTLHNLSNLTFLTFKPGMMVISAS